MNIRVAPNAHQIALRTGRAQLQTTVMMLVDAASVHKAVRSPELLIACFWVLSPNVIVLIEIAKRARSVTPNAATRVMMANVESSATRRSKRLNRNDNAPAGFAEAPC